MKTKKSFGIAGVIVAILATVFILFPLEYLRSGMGQRTVFSTVNLATSLTEWHWKSGRKYNCDNVYLLGYTASFSKTIPLVVEGNTFDISKMLADDYIIYVRGSDRITKDHKALLIKAGEFNRLVVTKCDVDRFIPKRAG